MVYVCFPAPSSTQTKTPNCPQHNSSCTDTATTDKAESHMCKTKWAVQEDSLVHNKSQAQTFQGLARLIQMRYQESLGISRLYLSMIAVDTLVLAAHQGHWTGPSQSWLHAQCPEARWPRVWPPLQAAHNLFLTNMLICSTICNLSMTIKFSCIWGGYRKLGPYLKVLGAYSWLYA